MKRTNIPQSSFGTAKNKMNPIDTFNKRKNAKLSNQKGMIRNWKHGTTKTSPMRLKIIRSRETSPVIQNSSSQTKIMGSVSIKKIKLVNDKNRHIGGGLKPVTTQISLCDNKKTMRKKTQHYPSRKNQEARKKQSHFKGAKLIELSFEEEIDVDNIYKENSILNEHKFQQSKRPKMHRRQISEFEEEGKENLSSEGDEHDTHEAWNIANPPKIQQEKFNDLNKKFSRNENISQIGNFQTDIQNDGRNSLYNWQFLSQKLYGNKTKEDNSNKGQNNYRRSMYKSPKVGHNLNRSRNSIRHTNSKDSSNWELASSSILSDKLRDTLKYSRHEPKHRYSNNKKKVEKEKEDENTRKRLEIKEKVYKDSKPKKYHQTAYDKRKVNNQLLGNIIKKNINELSSK